jgi:hypothetical protein
VDLLSDCYGRLTVKVSPKSKGKQMIKTLLICICYLTASIIEVKQLQNF